MPVCMYSSVTTWRSGDEIILNRKHTTRLNVAEELTKAFDRYRDGTLVLQHNIEDLKAGPLSLGDAQRKLFEMFYRRLLPTRMLIPVTDSYLSTEDRTDWGLLNALTLHAKNLPPKRQYAGTRPARPLLRIGKDQPLCLLRRRCQSPSSSASSRHYAGSGTFQRIVMT